MIVCMKCSSLAIHAEEAHGKTLGERAALMAEKWKCLTAEERKVYESRVQEANDAPLEVLSNNDADS